MKSYTLAVALAMLLSALYAFQNPGDVTVRFLLYDRTVPQGLWEVLLFSSGAVLMWVFSLAALLEVRKKYRGQIKALEKRAEGLEEERKSLLVALQRGVVEVPVVLDRSLFSAEGPVEIKLKLYLK